MFLKHRSDAAVNRRDSSVVEAAALVAHDSATASAVDVDAALDALSVAAAALGAIGLVSLLQLVALLAEGVSMLAERCCAAAKKLKRRGKTNTKREKRSNLRDLEEELLEAVSPRSASRHQRRDAVVVDVAAGSSSSMKPTSKTRQKRRSAIAAAGGDGDRQQELAVRKSLSPSTRAPSRHKSGADDVEERGTLQVPALSVSL